MMSSNRNNQKIIRKPIGPRNEENSPSEKEYLSGSSLPIQESGGNLENIKYFEKQHNSLLNKLFQTKNSKLVKEKDYELAKTEFKYRNDAVEMYREAQLQGIEEQANDLLTRGKAIMRNKLYAFFMVQVKELRTNFSKYVTEFSDFMTDEFRDLDKIKVPQIRQLEEDRLKDQIKDFYQIIKKFQTKFNQILDEELSRSSSE